MRRIAIGLLALALSACASLEPPAATDNYRAKNFVVPPPGALVVLLPAPKAPDLAAGEMMMTAQLHRQLRALGYRTALLDTANHAKVWAQEIEAVGGLFDPGTGAPRPGAHARALSSLARRICAEASCALVMQQRMVLREARLGGTKAEWDGQRRRVPVVGAGMDNYSFSGQTGALSVELVVFTKDGEPAFRSYGGASLPYRLNAGKEGNEIRPDLFDNDEEIADGVRIALQPLMRAA